MQRNSGDIPSLKVNRNVDAERQKAENKATVSIVPRNPLIKYDRTISSGGQAVQG